MHRHFQKEGQPAMCLSLEEEAIQVAELSDGQNAMNATIAEDDRVQGVATGMKDVQEIVAVTPAIGDAEMALVAAVAEMAVGGTDACADELMTDVLPKEGTLATENLDDIVWAVKKIWEKIKEFIARLWDDIKNLFDKTRGLLENLKGRIVKSRSNMKGLVKLKDGVETMSVRVERRLLASIDNSGSTTSFLDRFKRNIEENQGYIKNFVTKYPHAISDVGESITEGFNNYNPNDDSFVDFTKKLENSVGEMLRVLYGTNSWLRWINSDRDRTLPRGWRYPIAAGADPHGSMRIKVIMPDIVNTSSEATVRAYSQLKIEAETTIDMRSGSYERKISKINIDIPSLTWITSTLDNTEDYIATLLKIYEGEGRKLINSGADEIRKAGDAAIARLKDVDSDAKKELSSMMSLASAYSRWVGQPIDTVIKVSARSLKLMVDIADTAIAQYETA